MKSTVVGSAKAPRCNLNPSRTKSMKRIPKLILITLAFGLAVGVGAPAQAADKKPNILFIMGDDIGWMQPSCYPADAGPGELQPYSGHARG